MLAWDIIQNGLYKLTSVLFLIGKTNYAACDTWSPWPSCWTGALLFVWGTDAFSFTFLCGWEISEILCHMFHLWICFIYLATLTCLSVYCLFYCCMAWFYTYKFHICRRQPISAHGRWQWFIFLTLFARLAFCSNIYINVLQSNYWNEIKLLKWITPISFLLHTIIGSNWMKQAENGHYIVHWFI